MLPKKGKHQYRQFGEDSVRLLYKIMKFFSLKI